MNGKLTLVKGYDPVHFSRLAAIEERHFWFTSRRNLIASFARRIAKSLQAGCRVVEIGCGTGNVLGALEAAFPGGAVFGMDLFAEGLAFAARRGRTRLLQADAHLPPFRTGIDVIGAFDVIEHLPDDVRMLSDIHAMLRSGGYLLLTVPASKKLWSAFDEMAHHCRRYEKNELEGKLDTAGFVDVFVSPFMMATAPLVWLSRKGRPAESQSDASNSALLESETRVIPGVNAVLHSMLTAESTLVARRIRLPFGTSLIAVARKP